MANDRSGTNLYANTKSNSQRVCYRLWCDWDDVGYGNDFAGWHNESQYVIEIRGDMQAVGWRHSLAVMGHGTSNVCYVTLANVNKRFTLTYTDGPLYAKIGEGRVRMKRAVVQLGYWDETNGSELLNQITGYVVALEEQDHGRVVQLEIRDRAADALMTRCSTELYVNVQAGEYVQILLGLLSREGLNWELGIPFTILGGTLGGTGDDGVGYVGKGEGLGGGDGGGGSIFETLGGYGQVLLDAGSFPLYYAWSEQERIWDEIQRVAEAQQGRAYFDKDGDFHFEDGSHWVRPGPTAEDDPLTVQYAFNESDFKRCQPHYTFEDQYTGVVVSYVPYYRAGRQVIYSSAEVMAVPPGATRTVIAEFRYPADELVEPEPGVDYAVVTSGGTDLSASVTVTVTGYAGHAEWVIRNNHDVYTAYVSNLALRGNPVVPMQRMQYECYNDDADHQNTWRIRNPYITSYRQAEAIGDFVLDRFNRPIQYVVLTACRGVPWLEVGDRITVYSPNVRQDDGYDAYLVTRLSYRYWPEQGYTMDIEALRVRDLFHLYDVDGDGRFADYAIIGMSRFGTGMGHGHLFY
jgi:hypothetical protein